MLDGNHLKCTVAVPFGSSVQYLMSSYEEERGDCFTLNVLLVSCDCWGSVSLPSGVVGWSAVYDCSIAY